MKEGPTIQGDISVPISAIPHFLDSRSSEITKAVDGARIVAFGHLGDGNIHLGIVAPERIPAEEFLARSEEIEGIICDQAHRFGGAVAAEHGRASMKTDAFLKYRGDIEQDLMLAIKHSLDPHNMMNPGKVLKARPVKLSTG